MQKLYKILFLVFLFFQIIVVHLATAKWISQKYPGYATEFTGNLLIALWAINTWYNALNSAKYPFDGSENKQCIPAAQVLWAGTQKVGFGRAMTDDGLSYAVVHYAPEGTVAGKWKENVLPPKSGKCEQLNKPYAGLHPLHQITEFLLCSI